MDIYTYDIAKDFQNGVNIKKLTDEIYDQLEIYPQLSVIGDDIIIKFSVRLDQNKKSTLNSVIALHDATTAPITGNYVKDDSLSITTSTQYKTKLRMITNYLDDGVYGIFWSFNYINYEKSVDVRIILDDSIQIHTLKFFPKQQDETNEMHDGGFDVVSLGEGKHSIDLQFQGGETGTVGLWNVRMYVKGIK